MQENSAKNEEAAGAGEEKKPVGSTSKKRKLRAVFQWSVIVGVPIVSVVLVVFLLLRTPQFYYRGSADLAAADLNRLSGEFLKEASRAYNDIQFSRGWKAAFKEAQINGWLAEDFARNHADQALPDGVKNPRVAIEGNTLCLGFEYKFLSLKTVVHLRVEAWVPRPNVLVVEFHGAWAGALPIPTSYVRRVVEKLAQMNDLNVYWRRRGNHVVALLEFPKSRAGLILQRVAINNGEIVFRGQTGRSLLPPIDYAPRAN